MRKTLRGERKKKDRGHFEARERTKEVVQE